jgi:hypothetical protein
MKMNTQETGRDSVKWVRLPQNTTEWRAVFDEPSGSIKCDESD